MKRFITLYLILIFLGCSYGGDKVQSIFGDPPGIIKDPHYATYLENMDQLESQYLQKEISYAEYIEKKKQLEDDYTRDVRHREDVIMGNK